MARTEFVRFTGHRALAHRLVLATLTGRPAHISQIRSTSATRPGLAPHEVSFLRLLETVTNGSSIQISFSGTTVTYHPGLVAGAIPGHGAVGDDLDVLEHIVPAACARGITYFLAPLCLLAPFSKAHLNVRFSGPGVITSATAAGDVSVDTFRTAILPLYSLFGIPLARVELRVLRRSCAGEGGRGGGGAVELRFASQVRLPKTLHLNRDPGRVRRIRGVAYATGVSASNNGRMIHAARELLNPHVADIHIAAQYDQAPLVDAKAPPSDPAATSSAKKRVGVGFGISLVAESSAAGVLYSADVVAPPEGGALPEDLGRAAALQLLEAIDAGGCVGGPALPTVLTLMAMGSEDVGRVRVARRVFATESTVGLGRDLKLFGTSTWGLRDAADDDVDGDDADTDDLIVSVKGAGVGNVGRKIA
jgi:RNA 3'-terminal phosphate cyclase-like protein